jgi:hypothetical protein
MFVLALDVDEGDASRLFTVAETESIWPELTTRCPVDCRQLPVRALEDCAGRQA